jgi:hypothetical protein
LFSFINNLTDPVLTGSTDKIPYELQRRAFPRLWPV